MEATQLIDDSILEESEEEDDGEKRGEPLAKLRVLKNKHIAETELPLYQGENVLGRNPDSCSLPLVAGSVSKQHTIISISTFRGNHRHGNVAAMETEALVWDLGSMNGTRKGRTKLTPHVRYALTEGECVVIADIPCQYVSVDQRGGQGHMQNPTNAHSGRGSRSGSDRKAQLRGSPSGQGLGRETGTPKTEARGVNGEIGAPSLTELGGMGKNLAKPLSFEQTPTQPERTLVPESDSDGEQEGRRDKRGKYFVSDSDSHMSSPTCSTFLSPTTKVIPESEDESPITPSSSAKNRPKKIVSFSEEESDMDGPRQQPRRRRAQVIVDDSEEEEEGKEGTEALGEKETGKRTRGKEDVSVVNQVSQAERDRLTPSAPMVSTEDTFNMDSDTDVEGEEEMGLSAPVNAVKPPAATEPPTTDSDPGQIHMDSDTDVEEGDTMDGDTNLMLTAADVERKPVDSVPVVQPTEIHLDSDTDVDDDVVVSDSATNVTSFVSDPAEKPDDPAPAVPPVEFHLDTDTDVEEEDTDTHSKTVTESDSSGIRTGIAGPQEILLDSDTDEEDSPFTPPASSRTAELLNPPTSVGPAAAAPLEIRSDSDTDLEEDATQTMNLPPPNVTTVTEDAVLASRQAVLPSPTITTTTGAVTKTIALRSQDSDADTDAEEERLEPNPPRCQPPAGMVPEPAPSRDGPGVGPQQGWSRCRPPAGMVPESDLSEPSDFRMDSDTEEDGPGEAGQGQTACRLREGAAGPGLLPLGGSPGPHQKCSTPLASSVQEEMETQVFFCPSDPFRRPALPPVLRPTAALSCSASDSQEDDDFVVAETQSFVLEAQNQGHQSSLPVEPTLDATQPYGLEPSLGEDREEQPSRGSFQLGLSDSSHLHLQARDQASESTQAFSFPGGDSDLEATQTYGSGGGREEPGLGQRSAVFGRNRQVDFVLEATQAYGSGGGREEPGLGQRSVVFGRNRQVDFALEATQAYAAQPRSDTEEEDEEETPTTSNVATTETLPMSAYEEEDGEEEEDLVGAKPLTPVRRGRSGGAREREEEEQETQTGEVLTNQYLSTAQTLDMVQESDDEEEAKPDSPRSRRTQKQTVDEEERQTVSSYLSTAETQPMFTAAAAEDDDDNEEEELKPASPRRRGRSQRGRVEEEETQPSEFFTSSHISTAETQPMGTCDTEEEEDTKAKGQAQRERGKESEAGTSGVSSRGRRGARGGEEVSSETLKTQMRGKGKAVNTTGGGGRREVLPEEEESEKEEEAEVVEQGRRGNNSVKQQKEGEKERLEEEGIEKERQEQPEKERLQKEKVESERVMKEQQDRERMEQELKEQDDRLKSVEREETERMEREKREQEKREETERMEREKREETERMEREKREETENMKREETERMEREKREQEKEKKQKGWRERKEKKQKGWRGRKEKKQKGWRGGKEKKREKTEQEKRERLERERKEREEQERLQCERTKREKKERLEEEKERIERERKEIEERNRLEREEKEERNRLEREEKEERNKLEREEKEKQEQLERERVEKERIEGEQAEKQRSEKEKMEREEKRKQERELLKKKKEAKERKLKEKLESEKKEREKKEVEEKEKEIKERQAKEQGEKQAKKDDENELKTSRRGRRATTRRTVTVPPTTEPQPELNILSSTPEPVPASITRSRSNSSNSVSSERSSIDTLGSRGRGGRKTTSTTEPAPGPDDPTRNSTRRRTLVGTVVAPPAAVEITVQDILSSEQFVARRTRSSSTNSHSSTNSEVSTCIVDSVSSQSKGRGGGRRRKTGTESLSPSNRQSEQPPAHKPTARGRRGQKVEDDGPHPVINEKADSQEAGGTTRGQNKTAKTNEPDPVVAVEETTPAQVTEDSPAPRGNGRGRGRAGQKDNTPESTTTTAGGDTPSEEGVESKTCGRGQGRKRGLEEEEEEENSGFKVPRRKAKVQKGGRCRAAEEEGEKEEKPASTPAKRGRSSTAQVKKIAEDEKSMERQSEKMEEEEAGAVQRKVRGRQSTVQIKKKEEPVLDSNSVVPQTPTGKGRGKRRAPVESSPLARTPRSSSASPLSSLSSPGTLGPARAATQSYKVLFTGVVDEEGGKVVSCLGGSLAKGVADMTHLVTDRVRRTVKFLCAVARGVPVVTTVWLDKCGKVGRFLPTDRYLVKDREQENKFSFCLEESLRTASTQPLLQGYEVHVTRSVLPEPAQMKDIIVCSGARFLSTMPSTQKAQAQTLVISCGEDWSLCAPALSASLPVLSAEFLLTGILQQRVDLVTHVLSAPKPRAQPGAKCQARGRKRM
ncbi:mediator of DNA damage checkpoint protein 1 [Oncorhynchus kisutch]|uniref:mediator of DNA damage checkpoint protein 1 n=1 Tax=Oncorhynchus kisutch TaxID=8019 RepID=UPI0012DD2180|nr:mediator of DNA damage checkpoint protein 1-like [Oncorhynchus kisutch]